LGIVRLSFNLREIIVLTKASIGSRYRGSFAGFIWVLVAPLTTFALQGAVFQLIFKVSTENYLSYVFSGLLPWLFFSQSLEMTVGALRQNGRVLRSISISPLAMVMSTILDNMFNNLIVIFLIAIFVLPGNLAFPMKLFLFPLPYISLLIFTSSIAFLLSCFQVRYYDTKFILNFVLGLLFFVSPVLFPETFVPDEYRFILTYNPVSYILAPFREILTSSDDLFQFYIKLSYSYSMSILIFLLVFIFWRLNKRQIYLRFS
jgi:lipopolysaccharide transport system permease protein